MNEPTITIGGKTLTISELMEPVYNLLSHNLIARGQMVKEVVTRTVEACAHNANLLEALEDGTAFRIAFKKTDATDWTRVLIEEETALQAAAMEEIHLRQAGLMENLANLLGIDAFSINSI